MVANFEIIFLEEAIEFVYNLDDKARKKIFYNYNIDRAKLINDPKLFEKPEDEIWYFRTKYATIQHNTGYLHSGTKQTRQKRW